MEETNEATPSPQPRSQARSSHRWRVAALSVSIALVASAVGLGLRLTISRPKTVESDPRASGGDAVIAFVLQTDTQRDRFTGDIHETVATIRGDGTRQQSVLVGGSDIFFTGLAWSPDGTRVAFTRYFFAPGPGAILGSGATYVMNADGTGMRKLRICPAGTCPEAIVWSPDGTRLAYVLTPTTLGVMDASGANSRTIYECRGHQCAWPQGGLSWSPDSSKLLFAGMDQHDVGGLFVIDANGGPVQAITRCYSQLCYGGDRESNPTWSPDGRLIAFHRERNVFLVRPDGTGLHQLTSCPRTYGYAPCSADQPAWSSDGAKIAYSAKDGIHLVNRNGSDAHLILAVPKGNPQRSFSYCCISWKPVPGVHLVTSVPATHGSQIRVGVALSPPSGVGRSISRSDWAQFRGSADHSASNSAETALTPATIGALHQRWVSSVGEENVLAQSPVVVGGQVFVGASDGNLYAFNGPGCGAGTCPPEWAGRTGGPIQDTPAVGAGLVYVGSGDGLSAFDASGCGKPVCPPLWTGRTGGEIRFSSPTVADGLVLIGTADYDSRLYAFAAAGCGKPICQPVWVGTGFGNTGLDSTPAVANGAVYIHGMDAFLYAFRASGCGAPTCRPLWKGWTGSSTENESSPAVSSGLVFVGGGDCQLGDCGLWVFRAAGCGRPTCTPLWVADTPGAVFSSPAVGGGVVYFMASDSRLYAFDAGGCGALRCTQPLWSSNIPVSGIGSSPALAGGLVFVRSDSEANAAGQIYAFRAAGCGASDCSALWSAPAGGDTASSLAVSAGMVFVGGNDVILHAYGF